MGDARSLGYGSHKPLQLCAMPLGSRCRFEGKPRPVNPVSFETAPERCWEFFGFWALKSLRFRFES